MVSMIPMARYSNRMRPIHSLKHVVDVQGGLVAGTQSLNFIADAVDNPVSTVSPAQVETGSTVNSIFLNIQVAATGTAALANVYMAIWKNPGNNLTMPQANAIGISDNRRHVFHQEMIMTEKNTTAIPRTLFKGVLSVPKGMRRMGVDDAIVVALLAPGVNFDFCIQSIYKELQ